MSYELNILLERVYYLYQNSEDPPIPIDTIKEFLELEGISLDANKHKCKIKR